MTTTAEVVPLARTPKLMVRRDGNSAQLVNERGEVLRDVPVRAEEAALPHSRMFARRRLSRQQWLTAERYRYDVRNQHGGYLGVRAVDLTEREALWKSNRASRNRLSWPPSGRETRQVNREPAPTSGGIPDPLAGVRLARCAELLAPEQMAVLYAVVVQGMSCRELAREAANDPMAAVKDRKARYERWADATEDEDQRAALLEQIAKCEAQLEDEAALPQRVVALTSIPRRNGAVANVLRAGLDAIAPVYAAKSS